MLTQVKSLAMASEEQEETVEGSGHTEPSAEAAPVIEPRKESEQPNPCWSERITEEFRLRQARPLGLAEYDDRQLEPDYNGSEAGRSAGYRSVEVISARAASPLPTGEAQGPSGTAREGVSSDVPSVSSRSRSPIREDFASMKEMLVSFGGAIASLAEEHRTTQRRSARVEELKSGSNSSMRTGREEGEGEGAGVGSVHTPVGPQVFSLDEGDILRAEAEGRDGILPLEDWVQDSVRLEDIPLDPPVYDNVSNQQEIISGGLNQVNPGMMYRDPGFDAHNLAQAGVGGFQRRKGFEVHTIRPR